MPWSPPPGSLVSRTELLSCGVHPRRLASPEFLRPLPGYSMRADAPADLHRIAAVLAEKVLPGAVVSHASAAELLGWPVPLRLAHERTGVLHCRVPREDRRSAGRRVRVHRRAPRTVARFRGVPVSSDLEVLCDLAAVLTMPELTACIDHLVGPLHIGPRVRLDDVRERSGEIAGLHGAPAVRRAMALARERVESPQETKLRLLLVDAGFPEPAIDVHIWAPGAHRPYRLDLVYRREMVAIEYDGDWHRTDRGRFERDRRKDDVLHEYGWRVVRVTARDLHDPAALVARLEHLGVPRVL